jgi:hypothetical protein
VEWSKVGCPQIINLGPPTSIDHNKQNVFVIVDGMLKKQKQLKNVEMMW